MVIYIKVKVYKFMIFLGGLSVGDVDKYFNLKIFFLFFGGDFIF